MASGSFFEDFSISEQVIEKLAGFLTPDEWENKILSLGSCLYTALFKMNLVSLTQWRPSMATNIILGCVEDTGLGQWASQSVTY